MENIKARNRIFIATSIDGFIADKDGKIDWLHSIPNPDNNDLGYNRFISEIDAIIIGRKTFETVLSFGIKWPYKKPVFVLSKTLKKIPIQEKKAKIELIDGELKNIISSLNNRNYNRLYIDGGKTIQSFLEEDLIDEMIITIIPIVLGEGIPLISKKLNKIRFQCYETKIFLDQIVQNKFMRTRKN